MEYNFRSVFDHNKEYTIITDEHLDTYDIFSISLRKIDSDNNSYSIDNVECLLKYSKTNEPTIYKIELNKDNFNGFYLMTEKFKGRKCLVMGEGIELINTKPNYEFENINLENANDSLKSAFNDYLKSNNILEHLFQCFLHGVNYGHNNK